MSYCDSDILLRRELGDDFRKLGFWRSFRGAESESNH